MSPISDPLTALGFIQNADGSSTRISDIFPVIAASSDPSNPVLTKDVPVNQQNQTWARLYLPAAAAAPAAKLPLIVYIHGSGFVVTSAATSIYQKFCSDIVLQTPAVMVSVEYRLAPEHRLPAAYDDCEEALHWLKSADDEWLAEHADLSKCYIMGTSAGGNIAFHVGLRAAAQAEVLAPVKIRGLILHHPFFGGAERTSSEVRLAGVEVLPPVMTDVMWGLALPVGVDRDHEYCNPMKEVKVELLKKMKEGGWKVLVTGNYGDPLIDRQSEFAKKLEENGVDVSKDFRESGFHGIEIVDDSKARIFYEIVKNFLLAL